MTLDKVSTSELLEMLSSIVRAKQEDGNAANVLIGRSALEILDRGIDGFPNEGDFPYENDELFDAFADIETYASRMVTAKMCLHELDSTDDLSKHCLPQ